MLPIGAIAQIACLAEAAARKPGNVHPFASFSDLEFFDFLASAAAVGPTLDAAATQPVGQTVLSAIRATRCVTQSNTNLGIILLLAPLATVPRETSLHAGIGMVLDNLTIADAADAYEAIRLALPGGMGRVESQDIGATPTQTLREVMALAADRDLIALQYTNQFATVLDHGVPALARSIRENGSLETAIVYCHLSFLSAHPDSLIVRKRGHMEAVEAMQRAREVIGSGWPATAQSQLRFQELDRWLRANGNRRNPGTSADLVTASLFAALREGTIKLPCRFAGRWTSTFDEAP